MNNGIDGRIVEVVDHSAGRPESDDRGDSGVSDPTDFELGVLPRPKDPAAVVASLTDEELMAEAGVEPIFSTSEAAEFFDRSNQWLYWGLREGVFTYADGSPIAPNRLGEPDTGRRRFTVPLIKEIAKSSYRRGNLTPEQLKTIMRRVRYAELGVEWREREGWRHVHLGRKRYRWVHPDQAEYDNRAKEWKMKPKAKTRKADKADTE